MIKEIYSLIKELFSRLFSSRLFALALIFTGLFSVLGIHLFQMQIMQGRSYLESHLKSTRKNLVLPGTRGNIYDKDGKLLAYNELQYNITIADTGAFNSTPKGINNRNRMLYKLAIIIEKYQYPILSQFKVILNEDGSFSYATSSDQDRLRLLANVFRKDPDKLSEKERNSTAEECFEQAKKLYHFNKLTDENGNPISLSDRTALDMIGIIYTLRLTSYQRYMSTNIVENISRECMAEILESKYDLLGVDVENVSVRKYNYAPYLSHIVGYTGQVQEGQLSDLKKIDDSYEVNDIVGVWGLEKSEDLILKGKKGYKEMYLNNVGSIMEVISEEKPMAGNDIYTTISANDQISIYHLLEQELAGILSSKLTENNDLDQSKIKQSQLMIPVKDAYYQLINNNVLNKDHFFTEEAGEAEKEIASRFKQNKEEMLSQIETILNEENGGELSGLPQELQAYMVYIYDYLLSKKGEIVDPEDTRYKSSSAYTQWKNDAISLHDFLRKGIEEGWIDTRKLSLNTEYSDTNEIYALFVQKIMEYLRSDAGFDKLLYKYAIAKQTISGNLLLRALFEQNVLTQDDASYQALAAGDAHTAFTFLLDKIRKIELTPAQLALDPCNGSVVVTDVKTGKIRALVTYPGFDNNRISDAAYLKKCNEDLSLPLLNGATQTQLAPGSSFKPISSIASLEEGVINTDTIIDCTGKYEEVTPNIRCWIWPSQHGNENLVDGIKNSCNYFFADLGHRLATDSKGNYNSELGMERIRKYASDFGLNEKSGVELDEAEPRISTYDPERSAMGQANHAFNAAQLARYITAVANSGSLYKLSIVDKIKDPRNNVVEERSPELEKTLSYSDVTWNAVHEGLRKVITEGVAKSVFIGQNIAVAGKTGTAQEREDRGNHAVFVSYAPYDNPEISVTVNIPYGYSSGNAASLANMVYDYCFGKLSMDTILSRDASNINSLTVSD